MAISQRFEYVELEINSMCDMNCPHCDRFVNVLPAPPMTLKQVKHFVEESLSLSWEWKRIHILGGEPTLHRQLLPILDVLCEYRTYYPNVLLRVISNGNGRLADVRGEIEKRNIAINVEAKDGKLPAYFTNMYRAPLDVLKSSEPVAPCAIFGIAGCGLGLTRHGYFLCGAGAAIARITNQSVGVMKLSDVTYDAMLEQAKTLCNVCGHHESAGAIASQDDGVTPFWTGVFNTCKDIRNDMPLYGA